MAIPVQTMEESIALNHVGNPKIILAGGGMATGGRVVHHLETYGKDVRSTILLSGFQAAGTRGAALAAGRRTLRMHGQDITVRASVAQIQHLSAHADADDLMVWLRGFSTQPRHTFVVHGEPEASDALRQRIERELRWNVTMPEYRASYPLT